MTFSRSDLAEDPNPLAKASELNHPILLLVEPPPPNPNNPLSIAQHNGFVDGVKRGGNVGFIVGMLAGAGLTYAALGYFLRR